MRQLIRKKLIVFKKRRTVEDKIKKETLENDPRGQKELLGPSLWTAGGQSCGVLFSLSD